jgi:hypothetical protein
MHLRISLPLRGYFGYLELHPPCSRPDGDLRRRGFLMHLDDRTFLALIYDVQSSAK